MQKPKRTAAPTALPQQLAGLWDPAASALKDSGVGIKRPTELALLQVVISRLEDARKQKMVGFLRISQIRALWQLRIFQQNTGYTNYRSMPEGRFFAGTI
jgi:hypothetical protein